MVTWNADDLISSNVLENLDNLEKEVQILLSKIAFLFIDRY